MAKKDDRIQELWKERTALKIAQAELTAKTRALDEELQKLIPPNTVCAGIRHVYTESKSVSWAKAVKQAESLLSGVARGHLERAIAENTKPKTASRLQEAADE